MDSEHIRRVLRSAAAGSLLVIFPDVSLKGGEHLVKFVPDRPQVPAACLPHWGYNPTCWQRFPPVPPCDASGYCEQPAASGYGDSPIYSPGPPGVISAYPQSSPPLSILPSQDSSIVVPGSGPGPGSSSRYPSGGVLTPNTGPFPAPNVPDRTGRATPPLPELPPGLPPAGEESQLPGSTPALQSGLHNWSRYGGSHNDVAGGGQLLLPATQIMAPAPMMMPHAPNGQGLNGRYDLRPLTVSGHPTAPQTLPSASPSAEIGNSVPSSLIRAASGSNSRYGFSGTRGSVPLLAPAPQPIQQHQPQRIHETAFPLIQSSGFAQLPDQSELSAPPLRSTP